MIEHGDSYTVLIKEKEKGFENTYNLTLKSPVILVNCLPYPLDVKFHRKT
jgi:hypothetical protein